jgi:hypothetical protein
MSVGVSMRKSGPWVDKEWLHREYCDLGKTQKEIALENNTGVSTICRWMKHHGIETRPVSQTMSEIKKKFWSDEENKQKYLLGDKNPTRREDVKKKISYIVKGHWEGNEERKTQMSERSKSSWTSERREYHRERMKKINTLLTFVL